IALLLAVTNKVQVYNDAIIDGQWQGSQDYTFVKAPLTLLTGKSIGIMGYGAIGRRVGEIAEALGMTVNVYSRDPEAAVTSDVLSLNCPLTRENTGIVDADFISRMKDGAVLINTARGGLVDEKALADALRSGKLAGAGLDVMAQVPPEEDYPLIGPENCFITPHIAFIPIEARRTVVDTCADNLRSFINGGMLNRLV
ncbi:MAG: NAD(P)-dependent oxidoreductase, partial [Anaerovoracaceae bacterium]